MSSVFDECLWYALHIRPRFEKQTETYLKDSGYESYYPVYQSTRRWTDRIKTIELALLPGYVFCKFDVRNILSILIAPGVFSIAGNGTGPTAVAEQEILALQRIGASGLRCEPWSFPQVGEFVSVEAGPLAGLEGTVIEIKSNWRLILSLPLLQRAIAVEIDRDCVRKVPDSCRALKH